MKEPSSVRASLRPPVHPSTHRAPPPPPSPPSPPAYSEPFTQTAEVASLHRQLERERSNAAEQAERMGAEITALRRLLKVKLPRELAG